MTDKIILSETKEVEVRFSEVDSMGILWHGSYVKYLEDGREAFGKKYTLGYMDTLREGFFVPLTQLNMDFKKPLVYEEKAIVKTTFVPTDAAKILYKYEIRNAKDNSLILRADSVQVFLDKQYQLVWNTPEFYTEWKKKWNLI